LALGQQAAEDEADEPCEFPAGAGYGDVSELFTEFETDAHRRLRLQAQGDLEWQTIEERAVFYGELKGFAIEKGYKPGWAAMKYKDRFGYFPERSVEASPAFDCSLATRVWIDTVNRDFWRTQKRKGRK
jgi:hypothetical protein